MEITVPSDGIAKIFDRLARKIFDECPSRSGSKLFRVRYDKKICRRLRNVAYNGVLCRPNGDDERTKRGQDDWSSVKERFAVVCFNLKSVGLQEKAVKLERLVASLDFSSSCQQSAYTGNLSVLRELQATCKVLLRLSDNVKMMTYDVCEVWRKTTNIQLLELRSENDFISFRCDSNESEKSNGYKQAYQCYPSDVFEVVPFFGVSQTSPNEEVGSLDVDIFTKVPGSCGLTKWFGVKNNEGNSAKDGKTRLFDALVHSRTDDINVQLSLPELTHHSWTNVKRIMEPTMISEDEGFAEISDESRSSTTSLVSVDSGFHDLRIWDEALKHRPSQFYTWEGRKKATSSGCKPYLTEAGPVYLDHLYDVRSWEASYLINSRPMPLKYSTMAELIRDSLMVLIAVPSHTFLLKKATSSFSVSPDIRLSGCSPLSIQNTLKSLADIGTDYHRLVKFTMYKKDSCLIQSTVLRAFVAGLKRYLHEYRKSVVNMKVVDLRSILQLSTRLREAAFQLKFLADMCLCSVAFSAESGTAKPKFPVGINLLSYLYQLCLLNSSSQMANLMLYLLKVSCKPYLRFLQQWVFKGKCIDVCKEFMIHQNDIYLGSRDKHYWTNGYVMMATTKTDGVPVFLQELADDMFTCGKSINLLRLCSPEHYICNHDIDIPTMDICYSLEELSDIRERSKHYTVAMKELEVEKREEFARKENAERLERERILVNERRKANKALAEIQELLKKTKEALAQKKKTELDFLKKQMEDAINRKVLEAKQVDEVDASVAYEVTTAKLDEKLKEKAREELLRYYEELTRQTEKREAKLTWLNKRSALKQKRDAFLRGEMKNEEVTKQGSSSRKRWTVPEQIAPRATESTVQDLIYNSAQSETVDLNEAAMKIEGHPTDSSIQHSMYPSGSQLSSEITENRNTTQHTPAVNRFAQTSTIEELLYPVGHINSPNRPYSPGVRTNVGSTPGTIQDSTVQDLLYPVGHINPPSITSTRGVGEPGSTIQDTLYPTGENDGTGSITTQGTMQDSTVQDLLYPVGHIIPPTVTSTRGVGEQKSTIQDTLYPTDENYVTSSITTAGTMQDSTVQDLLYPVGHINPPTVTSTRGVGEQKSTIQDTLYPTDHVDGVTSSITTAGTIQDSTVQDLLYPVGHINPPTITSTRGVGEQKSTIQNMLYPDDHADGVASMVTTRGTMQQSTVQELLYPEDRTLSSSRRTVSTRGHAPPSTVQNLLYPTTNVINEEPERRKREEITIDDVWLEAELQPYPQYFDILDEEPFGDIFQRLVQDNIGLRRDFNDDPTLGENPLTDNTDACDVSCLPVILRRCVMEPLISQVNIVNTATVRYFMDDLKLMEHFETLKKFLLLEDGEFSHSLTRQLFEKVSSGYSPQQLCCISNLNSIMFHAIQSSVFACQSNNGRSLSFVLASIPEMFKRNDVGIFDFIQLRYKIEWPANIVITENCIAKYNRIFAFMLRLKRTAWILQDIRYSLKHIDKHSGNSPHLRKIHLFRHEMSHFVNDVQEYISNQVLHVTWQEFVHSLQHKVRNLDDLHHCHADYLNKALFRALLNKKAAPVMKIITDLLTTVLKFHTQILSSSWSTDRASGEVVHPAFSLLCKTHHNFAESTCFLFTVITKLISRGYQPHLEELLLRLDFNAYYGTKVNDDT